MISSDLIIYPSFGIPMEIYLQGLAAMLIAQIIPVFLVAGLLVVIARPLRPVLAAADQADSTDRSVKTMAEVVKITESIVRDLNRQKDMNHNLLKIVNQMKSVSEHLIEVGQDQSKYFDGLGERFKEIMDFFNDVHARVEQLGSNMSEIRFVEESVFQEYAQTKDI